MKHFIPVIWWIASAFIIAMVLVSLGYPFDQALTTAALFLPGMLCARYFLPQISFTKLGMGIYHSLCLTGAILVMEYLSIMLASRYIFDTGIGGMPDILMNPLFLLLVLTAFVTPGMVLENYIKTRYPYDRTVSFTSDRRKVTLDTSEILYVESNDSEVWLHTVQGESYRTKTRISQWEAQLDKRFLRAHRSYIVNTEHIAEYHPACVVVGTQAIEISRKYKDHVRQRLTTTERQK
ncbi:LytTR family DNA-binding domain-containing protein [uncultured Alistipes sp.]|uniref:LytR/AlgR family response regulator transcription factor n=1 Tax=uncultured Alistipes sp. TaxID=538949 RepID=UPI0025CDD1D5|nr:LytTR family DNA-binding domain-containing protein [uncultured Alistipes sp.]